MEAFELFKEYLPKFKVAKHYKDLLDGFTNTYKFKKIINSKVDFDLEKENIKLEKVGLALYEDDYHIHLVGKNMLPFFVRYENFSKPCGYRVVNTAAYSFDFCMEDEWKDKDVVVVYNEFCKRVSFELVQMLTVCNSYIDKATKELKADYKALSNVKTKAIYLKYNERFNNKFLYNLLKEEKVTADCIIIKDSVVEKFERITLNYGYIDYSEDKKNFYYALTADVNSFEGPECDFNPYRYQAAVQDHLDFITKLNDEADLVYKLTITLCSLSDIKYPKKPKQ